MADKPKVLSDKDIVTKVLAKGKNAVGWADSRLSKERQRINAYYNGELPRRQHEGASSFVSTDVYDGVEMLKAQLLEVFAGGDTIAQFDPDGQMNVENCRVATEYARYVIFRENSGYDIFQSIFHDGLTARIGVSKVFWEEKFEYEDEEFEGLQPHEAMGLAAQEDTDEFDGTLHEDTGTYHGTRTKKIDKSKVSIVVVAPEEFIISPRAISLHDRNTFCAHRTQKAKSELIDMGYDRKTVEGLAYGDEKSLDMAPEVVERNRPVETGSATDDAIQPEQDKVIYYESYAWMQIDPSKGTRLYKICHVNDTLLDKQEVDRVPFLVYVPLPVPHTFYGNSFAARLIPFQNAQTVLTRGVLDHTAITTNPRWTVVKGGLINPREMQENRLGGLVNIRTEGAVQALQYPNLNPFIFQVLGMLKDNKEQSTGISSLSQGLNKDAISQQNSQALVDQLVTLSSQRQKIAARNFAYNFFVPLMIEVIRLAIANDKKQKWIEVAGAPMQVTPQQWTERTTCSVSLHLGYGEKDQTINQMTQAFTGLSQDPKMARMFGEQNAYDMAQDIMKLRGWGNATKYLTNPATLGPPPPPQPDPVAMAEAGAKQQTAQAALINASAKQTHEQTHAAIEGNKLHQGQQKLILGAMAHDREQDRKDLDTAHRMAIGNQEMALAEKTEKREAIIAPR